MLPGSSWASETSWTPRKLRGPSGNGKELTKRFAGTTTKSSSTAQDDPGSIASSFQHLQRRKQLPPDADGNVVHEQDLRVKHAHGLLNCRDSQGLGFFQSDAQA